MPANLNKTLQEIQQTLSNPSANNYLNKIRKYTQADTETAYLLGKFIKTNTGQKLPEDVKKKLRIAIKNNNLEDYFYLKERPEKDRIEIILYTFLVGVGIPMLCFIVYRGFFDVLFFVPRGTRLRGGGGMPGMFVVAALVLAAFRLGFHIKKKKFVADLDKTLEEDIATN